MGKLKVSINSTSEEVRSRRNSNTPYPHLRNVSINSTSEEVRSLLVFIVFSCYLTQFPLIQLPRKSEDHPRFYPHGNIPRVSINSTSEEVRSFEAARAAQKEAQVSINSTSEEVRSNYSAIHPRGSTLFPLIQLPRKSEAWDLNSFVPEEESFH